MKRCIAFLAAVLLSGVFCGCVGTENVENSKRLRVGMTKEQVLDIMGEPLRDAAFHEENVWYYFIRINWYDGLYTRDECMPLVFVNDKLAGWGNEFKARLDTVAPAKKFTPPADK